MPRRLILSAAERKNLLDLPDSDDEMVRHYAFNESDLSLIRQRRTDANRLGFAVQLCLLRFPGQGLLIALSVPGSLLHWIGQQLRIEPACWHKYAEREETRREHALELRAYLGLKPFRVAKNKHQQGFQSSGKAINNKVRLYGRIGQALLDAKQSGEDPFAAIESVLSWNAFAVSVKEAQKLAQPADFDFLHRIGESYATLRRYAPEFMSILNLRAAPTATCVLDAIDVLREMYANNSCKVPIDAPIEFIKRRWERLVVTDIGLDRRYYELCAMSELKNALRSGDVWVQGSRQYRDFDDYLVPADKFATMKSASVLPLAVSNDCDRYLHDRLSLLLQQLDTVNTLAAANDLPDAIITEAGLKTTPLDAAVPDAAQALIDRSAMLLPQVKITELLMEVDEWTGFTKHFTHLKTGDVAKDKTLLLTTILADGINLGLSKMAESCPSTSYDKLSWLQAWHIRDETYSTALSELVNAQFYQPFALSGKGRLSAPALARELVRWIYPN